jgi:hypothetical protein
MEVSGKLKSQWPGDWRGNGLLILPVATHGLLWTTVL